MGELWFYTGGPHGGWAEGSAWAALDFVPDEGYLGCQAAASWATAAAPGLVIYSQDGEVMIDLDGDGHEETGWVLFYLHVGSQGRVPVDTRVKAGRSASATRPVRAASPSPPTCTLPASTTANGSPPTGRCPLSSLAGSSTPPAATTKARLTRGSEERTACECRDAAFNGLVAGE